MRKRNDFNMESRVDRRNRSYYLNIKTQKFERVLNFKGKLNKEVKW